MRCWVLPAWGTSATRFPIPIRAYKDCDSQLFVTDALAKLSESGWRVVNVDLYDLRRGAKLGPIKMEMRKHLALILRIPWDTVNVKAKTGEKVGAIGRAEAIGCQVVVLIESQAGRPVVL